MCVLLRESQTRLALSESLLYLLSLGDVLHRPSQLYYMTMRIVMDLTPGRKPPSLAIEADHLEI
jgi:hypothetical protein